MTAAFIVTSETEGRVHVDRLFFRHLLEARKHTLQMVGVACDTSEAGERIVS